MQVLQALVLHLDYCSVVWSGATQRDLRKLQLAQNRAARLALKCTWRANNNMHVNLSWLKVEERLTSSLLVFVRSIDTFHALSCLLKTTSKQLGHTCIPHKTCHKRSLQSPSPEQTNGRRCTVLHRPMTTWNSIPHQVTDASSKMLLTDKINTLWNSGDCEETQT